MKQSQGNRKYSRAQNHAYTRQVLDYDTLVDLNTMRQADLLYIYIYMGVYSATGNTIYIYIYTGTYMKTRHPPLLF